MMKTKLTDITDVIRSKNSGPYELTLDIIFKDYAGYNAVKNGGFINEKLLCSLYGIRPEEVITIVNFEPAKAIKMTIVRPLCSGHLGETDVYGVQQHAPLLGLEFDL